MPMMLALLSVATSCSQEDMPPAVTDSDVVEVTATIGPPRATRVSQSADNEYVFDFGDKIHIVGWYGEWNEYAKPWEDATDIWWNDAVSTFNGRRWKTEPYMRWQNGDELQHNFLAWCPEDFVDPNSNLTNIAISLTGDPEEDDILVAKWSNTRPDDNTLRLEFEHLLSRFDLHLKFGSEYPDAEIVSVLSWLPRTGTCDLLNNEFRGENIQAHITYEMYEHPYPASEYDWSGSCITIPMTVLPMRFITIKCTNAGKEEYIYSHPTNIILKPGERTTLTLYIGKDKVELGSITAAPWETENGGNLETE